ncbi:MAG: D-alanyl-D-alanine carboxypeptidase family protein [Pyrinomonadaceae bacterium]
MNFFKISLLLLFLAGASLPVSAQKENRSKDFTDVVKKRLSQIKIKDISGRETKKLRLDDVCPVEKNIVAKRVFAEYGAVFVGADSVTFPAKCVFESESEVQIFQSVLGTKIATLNGVTIELQSAAMDALYKARKEAEEKNFRIGPRGGSSAGKRSYADTARIWKSRFDPALIHWGRLGKISASDAEAARKMTTQKQVEQVIEWESRGYFFATDFSRTIFSSVAAPGTSQHLAGLAIDVVQFNNSAVRTILNKHGWYQTVANDTPHFTFLGMDEDELPERGLKLLELNGYRFWVPNIKST